MAATARHLLTIPDAAAPQSVADDSLRRAAGPSFAQGVLVAVLLCVLTRLLVWSCAYSGALLHVRMLHALTSPIGPYTADYAVGQHAPRTPVETDLQRRLGDFAPLMQWDGWHYHSILHRGYSYRPATVERGANPEAQSNIAFFPLYPILAFLPAKLIGLNAGMIAVSNLAALAAAAVIYLLGRRLADHTVGLSAVVCTFAWPTASFHSFAYPESLTLLLVALTMLLALNGRWWAAALVCGAACAARPTAIGLAPLLALSFLVSDRSPLARRLGKAAGVCVVGGWGLLAYAMYLWIAFGSPQVYFDNFYAGWVGTPREAPWWKLAMGAKMLEQFKHFARVATDFPLGLTYLTSPLTWNVPVTLFMLFLSLGGLARVPAGLRPLLLLGPLIFLQRYAAAPTNVFAIESLARYTCVAVPAFLVFGAWVAREWSASARAALLALLLLLQASWAFHFGMAEWTG